MKQPPAIPNFFILGAARAATSSLFLYLRQHPQVFMSSVKEPAFFGFHGTHRAHKTKIKSWEAYQRLFDGARDEIVVGEATPSYLCIADSATAIHAHCPRAKLLVSLRDPVERAFSYYEMGVTKGRISAPSFETWIEGNTFWTDGGRYAPHLERYIKLFGRQQLLVLLFDDVQKDTARALHAVYDHLEIDPTAGTQQLERYGTGGRPRSKLGALVYRATSMKRVNAALRPHVPDTLTRGVHWVRRWVASPGQMKPETEQSLRAYFRDDILRTQNIIERDLSAWL